MSRADPGGHRRVVWNSALTTLMFLTSIVTSLVMAPVLVRSLGAEAYGAWELALGVVSYVVLLDLGMSQAVVRYVAVARGAGDEARLQRVFGAGLAYFGALAVLGAALLAAAAIDPSMLMSAPARLSDELRLTLLLFALTFACNYLCTAPICFLLGVQAHTLVNAFRVIKAITQTIAMIRLLDGEPAMPMAALATVILVAAVVELVFFVLVVALRRPAPRHRPLWSAALMRELLGFGSKSAVLMAVSTLMRGGMLFVLAHFAGVAHVVFFVFPLRLVEYAQSLGQAMGVPLTPYFADAFGRAGAAPTGAWLVSTRALQFFVFGTALGTGWLGLPFLALWMGPEYAARGAASFALLCAGLLVQATCINANRLLFSLGRHGVLATASSALAAACLVAAVPLVAKLGIEGAAIATAVFAAGQSVIELRLACRHLGIDALGHVRATVARYGPPMVLGSAVLHALARIQPADGYATLGMHAVLGGTAYAAACMLTALDEVERGMLLASVKTRAGWS